ncbi:MAG: NUDIX hydrolase, partial [Patescibacteria group bacterium]
EKYGRGVESVYFKFQDGSKHEFYIKQEKNPVFILALTENNEVILTKQFRPGPKKIFMGLPGGEIDKGETPEEAATRELLEETGYGDGDIKLAEKTHLCGYSTSQRYTFVATNCKHIKEQELDSNEEIDISLTSTKEFRKLLQTGKILETDIGYLGLDYLNLL